MITSHENQYFAFAVPTAGVTQLQVLLFPVDRDTHFSFCRLQSYVQTNHVVHEYQCTTRPRVVPLSLRLTCVTRKKTRKKIWLREILGARSTQDFTRQYFFAVLSRHAQQTKRKRDYSWSSAPREDTLPLHYRPVASRK